MKKNMNEKRYNKVINECKKLVISRNEQYGDSVDIMRIQSIIDLCLMKLIRTRTLKEEDPKTKDEFIDCINYIVFALEKLEK